MVVVMFFPLATWCLHAGRRDLRVGARGEVMVRRPLELSMLEWSSRRHSLAMLLRPMQVVHLLAVSSAWVNSQLLLTQARAPSVSEFPLKVAPLHLAPFAIGSGTRGLSR